MHQFHQEWPSLTFVQQWLTMQPDVTHIVDLHHSCWIAEMTVVPNRSNHDSHQFYTCPKTGNQYVGFDIILLWLADQTLTDMEHKDMESNRP